MSSTQLLKSRLAIVTGGGSGIGKAICEKLAENGAKLIVADINEESAIKTANSIGKDHMGIHVDISNSKSIQQLNTKLISMKYSTPWILVNCAGITKDSTMLKMSEENWKSVIEVNLTGVFRMTQMVAKLAVEQNTPLSIVNISSIVGKLGNFGQTNYSATKAGVIGFTKSAARELASKNIRVNAVLPGFIRTPMTSKMPPKVLNSMISLIPQGRMGESEDIANTVLFLSSDLSSYITGTTIEVTGGFGM